jgi:hypothetical protein
LHDFHLSVTDITPGIKSRRRRLWVCVVWVPMSCPCLLATVALNSTHLSVVLLYSFYAIFHATRRHWSWIAHATARTISNQTVMSMACNASCSLLPLAKARACRLPLYCAPHGSYAPKPGPEENRAAVAFGLPPAFGMWEGSDWSQTASGKTTGPSMG